MVIARGGGPVALSCPSVGPQQPLMRLAELLQLHPGRYTNVSLCKHGLCLCHGGCGFHSKPEKGCICQLQLQSLNPRFIFGKGESSSLQTGLAIQVTVITQNAVSQAVVRPRTTALTAAMDYQLEVARLLLEGLQFAAVSFHCVAGSSW